MSLRPLPELPAALLQEFTVLAAQWTGFSIEAIHPSSILHAVGENLREGLSLDDVLIRARTGDPETLKRFFRSMSVGETFFFRQPEHFDFIAEHLRRSNANAGRVNAWSAGCATGEEAFSLAAVLLEEAGAQREVRVLGTDLSDHHLMIAEQGYYGVWSVRASTPLRCPLFAPKSLANRQQRILEPLRRVTRFAHHNLLDVPPEGGPFDLILCRNVLIYFAPAAARQVVCNLVGALAPGGLLLFGPMDLQDSPEGLERIGAAEKNIFRKPVRPQPVPATLKLRAPMSQVAKVIRTPCAAPPASASASEGAASESQPVTLHLHALVAAESGERGTALRILQELTRRFPDYVPGLVDAALANGRDGRADVARAQMQEVLRRTDHLDGELAVAGPQTMNVEWYRRTATAFLQRTRPPSGRFFTAP